MAQPLGLSSDRGATALLLEPQVHRGQARRHRPVPEEHQVRKKTARLSETLVEGLPTLLFLACYVKIKEFLYLSGFSRANPQKVLSIVPMTSV